MGKIHVLPPQEALKIAAGEVIERPAHVIKELLENSIDAGATAISIYINDAGKTLIRIVDNGCGMEEEDAIACFLPHATSKISSVHELEQVSSFGFRGEALASISAISMVTLYTKQANDELGTAIDYQEGAITRKELVACAQGTDISIKDLFYNTPVRKKFLKQDETEWNALQATVHAYCLSNPSIHIKLYHNGSLMLNAPPVTECKDRALQVWDTGIASNFINLLQDETVDDITGIKITGYISRPTFWRYGRQYIYFFVNGRWVKNAELSKGLFKGYLNVLPPGRFPAAVIFVTVPPTTVDINVHPKKEEVKFTHPGVIQTNVALLVKKTLENLVTSSIGSAQVPEKLRATPTYELPEEQFVDATPFRPWRPFEFAQTNNNHKQFNTNNFYTIQTIQNNTRQTQDCVTQDLTYTKIIGQLFATYIMLEKETEFVLIDQHAAHERILYEKYQKTFDSHQGTALIFPETMDIPATSMNNLVAHKNFFERQGISFDVIGASTIVIRSTPHEMTSNSLKEFIMDALTFINEYENIDRDLFGKKFQEHLHAQRACKSAIKAGDILSEQLMQKLIDDLLAIPNRFICVHGRPTMWTITKTELEKKFKRA